MSNGDIPIAPLFILDDDDWLDIYDNERKLLDGVEGTYIDEVVAAFDAEARPLKIGVRADTTEVEGVYILSADPDLHTMYSAVESFFLAWTESEPPARTELVNGYIGKLLTEYNMAKVRPRRARYRR